MNITVLGSGSWGYTLQVLLANQGHRVIGYSRRASQLLNTRIHPRFPDIVPPKNLTWTDSFETALNDCELLIESVTSSSLRHVFESLSRFDLHIPIVITSKGLEQNTLLTLPQVVLEVLGPQVKPLLSVLSGPSFANDVIHGKPTSVVIASYHPATAEQIAQIFHSPTFRVYPNQDMQGVCFGGAMKNVIAVGCAMVDGMKLGTSAKAALFARGLHEMRKIAPSLGALSATLNGISGVGDLLATCSSHQSRNYRYGYLLAQGHTHAQALEKIGMVVEGAYSAKSFYHLSLQEKIPLPITETIYQVIYEQLPLNQAIDQLMQRKMKNETL